ncbi:MAG: signal peptidase II [Candidatus Omnitrophica bacterium]|nr:signal peptidase II [Candidatus Omnitrophota bacterium]
MKRTILFVSVAVFTVDFFVKNYFRLNHAFKSIPVIKDIFHLTVVFNRGAAFGILQGKTLFLIIFSLILIILFGFFIWKENEKRTIFLVSYGLIFGGALSNLYERIFLGFVVDYIDLRVWPVFNISDSCITIGIGLIFFKTLFGSRKNEKNHNCS